MFHSAGKDAKVVPLENHALFGDLDNGEGIARDENAESTQGGEVHLQPFGAANGNRSVVFVQGKRTQEPRQTVDVITVKVGDTDDSDPTGFQPGPYELKLSAFPAIEESEHAVYHQCDRSHIPRKGWLPAGRSQRDDAQFTHVVSILAAKLEGLSERLRWLLWAQAGMIGHCEHLEGVVRARTRYDKRVQDSVLQIVLKLVYGRQTRIAGH